MTRFARAKGSKASNERREEDATPWHVMRQQLVNQPDDSLKNNEDLSEIVKKVTNSQLEHTDEIWSDFGILNQASGKKKKITSSINKERKNKLVQSVDQCISKQNVKGKTFKRVNAEVSQNKNINSKANECVESYSHVIKKPKLNNKQRDNKNITTSENNSKIEVVLSKRTIDNVTDNIIDQEDAKINSKLDVLEENYSIAIKKPKLNNNKKRNHKNITSKQNSKIEAVSNKGIIDNVTDNIIDQKEVKNKTINKDNNIKYKKNNNQEKNIMGWKNDNRNNNPYTIIANGREIRIIRYDGFLVKKDDADRLKTLRKKLKSENIPTDKIKDIMKLERRRAEKALAREKNTVCFQCRNFGHNFADCPDIKESEAFKSGICFKCGSTEHTHFQCKVSQNQNFRYAVCFVCKEQGHIARQCTLNPQGQYPKGGSCHLCGEVTHLRKDCPKAVEEKSSNALTVNSFNSRRLEDIDEVQVKKKNEKNKKKVVSF